MEALVNMADVLAELWPADNTARILLRILIHYKFAVNVREAEGERCKIMAEFCDSVLRENASRAVGRLAPLSFRQAKERWSDITERYGPPPRGGRNDGRQQQAGAGGSGGAGGGGQRNGGNLVRGRAAKHLWQGKQYGVCFEFNKGSCSRKPSGCGCEERGVTYAHVCNYFLNNLNRHCLAQHPRVGNH
jgi:hypothetical protein